MSLAEELKNLITLRDLFSGQLTNEKISEETKQHLNELIESTTKRIHLILDIMISENAASNESNAKKLQDGRSKWFNDFSRSVLRILVAREIAERIDVTKIFSVLWSF